jgi:Ca-activated chloride channel family protein
MPVADAEMSGTKQGGGLYVRVGDRSVQRKRKSEEQPTRVTSAFKGDSGGEGEYHPEGRGPGQRGDQHSMIVDNPLRRVADEPLSTFSIDVDTAAYSKLRSLLASGQRPAPETLQWLRVEEMINYFGYDYPAPRTGEPFSVNIETAACPWAEGRRLVRIGLKGREIDRRERPPGNFVFLLDVSGSMTPPNRLPLVLEGMRLLTRAA